MARILRGGIWLLAILPVVALADSVFWGCAYGEPKMLRSGQTVCRQEVRDCNRMSLTCSRGSRKLFTVEDFADYIAASDDSRYIVGLSNRGSVNAFWIRDSAGKLIEWKTHSLGAHHWKGVHYCMESLIRRPRPSWRFGAIVIS